MKPMGRRQIFAAVAAAAASAGVALKASTVDVAEGPAPPSKPSLILLEIPGHLHLSREMVMRMRDMVTVALTTTPFAGLPVLVLEAGLTLTILDADGTPLNRALEEV